MADCLTVFEAVYRNLYIPNNSWEDYDSWPHTPDYGWATGYRQRGMEFSPKECWEKSIRVKPETVAKIHREMVRFVARGGKITELPDGNCCA